MPITSASTSTTIESSSSSVPTPLSKRSIFDKMTLHSLTYLETCFPSVALSVSFSAGESLPQDGGPEAALWEKKNAPLRLPADLKSFYAVFNGVDVSWSVDLTVDRPAARVGEMRVNRIEDLRKIHLPLEHFFWGSGNSSSSTNSGATNGGVAAVFSLDKSCEVGEVVLLYRSQLQGVGADRESRFDGADCSAADSFFMPRQFYQQAAGANRNENPEVCKSTIECMYMYIHLQMRCVCMFCMYYCPPFQYVHVNIYASPPCDE